MDDKLAALQARRDEITAEIRALREQARDAELKGAAEKLLDALPEDERGVLIKAAAIRVGAKPAR